MKVIHLFFPMNEGLMGETIFLCCPSFLGLKIKEEKLERETLIQEANLKKVKVILRNGYNYTGRIINIGFTSIDFKDQFGNNVILDISEIVGIEEVKE